MASSSAGTRPVDGRISPAPTPHASKILRQIAQLLEYDDADTLANVTDYLELRLELLSARAAIH